jgi:hypothetical protein
MTGGHPLKKSIGGIVALVVLICAFGYVDIANNIQNQFTIDEQMTVTESSANQFLHTTRQNEFRLVNLSDKTVKLLGMQLQNYSGIRIGQLTIDGKPVGGQEIQSNRIYTSRTSWTTDSQGTMVDYNVYIEQQTIQNPRAVLITYSYLGMKHTQIVELPYIHS